MRERIVIADGFTANPGDLTWDSIAALGDLTVHERTATDELAGRAGGARILLTNKTVITADHLAQLPELAYIGVMATGVNVVDLDAARARGITVTNVPAYSTPAVAQLVFALILHFTNRVATHAESVDRGDWARCPDFCYWLSPLQELAGKTMGLVGYGQIAQQVGTLARAFGMQLIVHSRREMDGVENVSREALFSRADVVSLHCPLTDATHHLINRETIALMKPTALLINTGRGPLVDEEALAEALERGQLAGAGLDVLTAEPPEEDHPLYRQPTCVITPHIGWATREARMRLIEQVAENIRAFQAGAPVNVVNAPPV